MIILWASVGSLPSEAGKEILLDARIPKLRAEAAKLKARIDNLTARYNATIDKVTELENLEIVGLVRAEHISIEQLAALIKGGDADA